MRFRSVIVFSVALGWLAAAPVAKNSSTSQKPVPNQATPPALDDGWKTGSLEQGGIDRKRLDQMTESIRAHPEFNIHALLIEHDGRLVYEQYFSGSDQRWGQPLGVVTFNRDTLHDLRSVTKSVVSALVGIAIGSKAIVSLDVPLLDYFPEYKDLPPELRKLTIRHALTMTAGLEWNEDVPYTDPKNDEIAMTRSPDPLRYVFTRPIVSAPGTSWQYNGGTTQVLGTIVQRATKQPLAEYARAVLFAPLGITKFEWLGDLAGVPSAASGLRLRPRDLAKFASLYLHDGRWNGRQVIPSEWVRESTRRRVTLPKQTSRGYAYQWWHACLFSAPWGPVDVPTAVGNGAQRLFLLRSRRTAVTFLAGRYNDFSDSPPDRLLMEFILPALPASASSTCPE
jgi:CubicO group peptidase (beta-lactamase class C family)